MWLCAFIRYYPAAEVAASLFVLCTIANTFAISYRALFRQGNWPVSQLRQAKDELEELERSSAARICDLEGQLRAAATAAPAADAAAATVAAAAAAKFAADSAAASAAHKIELLEHKLSAQASFFELKLATSVRIARLEERIYMAGLRAEVSALRNPLGLGQRRYFSS